MKSHALFSSFFACLVVLALWVPPAGAYPRYSQGKVTNPDGAQEAFGNCKTCHGGFRDADYISPADGRRWLEIYQEVEADAPEEEPGLHDIHRHIMLDKIGRSRCNVCHLSTGRYPVVLNSSATSDLEPVSCMGCHGRNEDEGNDSISAGLGAGLRQHHTRARVKECMTCHADANPARYEPVGEDVLPPYYAAPNDVFVNKPTDLCNQRGDEDYAGGPKGLDNDGDGRYDKSDLDCEPIGAGENNSGLQAPNAGLTGRGLRPGPPGLGKEPAMRCGRPGNRVVRCCRNRQLDCRGADVIGTRARHDTPQRAPQPVKE